MIHTYYRISKCINTSVRRNYANETSFFKSKNEERFIQTEELTNVPEHVAIIMDGNGRWAKRKGLPRIAGHKAGMDVVKKRLKRPLNTTSRF